MEKGFEIVSTLPIWQFDVLLLILVVLFAVVALSIRNLMGAAVVFGAYSFMMCLIWAGMGAVDVAFTEAAVGAGVSTVFVVSTLYNTGATVQPRTGGLAFKLFIGVVVTIAGAFLLSALPDFPEWGASDSPVNAKVAPYYILNTIADSHVPNVVTSVLADYRGFDTLLETTVVFIACIAIYSILRVDKAKLEAGEPAAAPVPRYDPGDSLIVRQASRFMVPFMQLFALYVIAGEHVSVHVRVLVAGFVPGNTMEVHTGHHLVHGDIPARFIDVLICVTGHQISKGTLWSALKEVHNGLPMNDDDFKR